MRPAFASRENPKEPPAFYRLSWTGKAPIILSIANSVSVEKISEDGACSNNCSDLPSIELKELERYVSCRRRQQVKSMIQFHGGKASPTQKYFAVQACHQQQINLLRGSEVTGPCAQEEVKNSRKMPHNRCLTQQIYTLSCVVHRQK